MPELKKLGTSYYLVAGSAGFAFDFVADFFRVRGRFLGALRLRAADLAFGFAGADACRFRDASRCLRSFFSFRYLLNFL